MSAPSLNLDRSMSARRSGDPSTPGAPRPRRRSGVSARRVVVLLVVLAAGYAAWRHFSSSSPDGGAGRPAESADTWIDLSRVPPEARPIAEYLLPSPDEAKLWFDTIRTSTYVRQKWADSADAVSFEFLPGDDRINAFAGFAEDDPAQPVVVLCGGLVRLARLVGAFEFVEATARARGEEADAEPYFKRLSELVFSGDGTLSFEGVTSLLDEFQVPPAAFQLVSAVSSAKALSDGVCKTALAHEMGHIAAGHPRGAVPNQTVSRNEEAQADLFASSVAASVANGDQMLMGQLLHWYVFALGEQANPDAEIFRSHPFSADRLRNAVNANRELAASIGISSEDVDGLVGESGRALR